MASTFSTRASSRHSRNTAWPTIPLAPNIRTFMCPVYSDTNSKKQGDVMRARSRLLGRCAIFGAAICMQSAHGVAFAQEHDRVVELLQTLSNAPGPSGFEEAVRKIMVAKMRPLSEDLRFDGMGSVIARQGKSGPRIMIDAHMDEL